MQLALIAAHLLGDFWAQNQYMATNKFRCYKVRTWHVFTYALCYVPFLWVYAVPVKPAGLFLFWLFVSHWLTDCRRWASAKDWAAKPIMVDQAIHVTTIAILYKTFFSGS